MSEEWKPGDVALAGGDVILRQDNGSWVSRQQSGFVYTMTRPRRLLLIDPEDGQAAERLMRAYWQQRPEGRAMSDSAWIPDTEIQRMQTAIRALSADQRDYQGTHRAVPTIDEQPAPTTFPEGHRCWAVYQGRHCGEHSDGGAR